MSSNVKEVDQQREEEQAKEDHAKSSVTKQQQEHDPQLPVNDSKLPANASASASAADNAASVKHNSDSGPSETDGDGGDAQNDDDDDDDDANPKKKAKTERAERVPTIPGFDLPIDTSTTILPPSKVGTSVFNEHDVLSGRGGGTNVHFGNRSFRDIINKYRTLYLRSKKNDKPAISRAIVKEIRSRGGRFLKKNEKDNLYYEIGDAQAREKTSQALRQRAPEMRKLMFEQQQLGAPGSGMSGIMGGMGVMPSQLQPLNGAAASTNALTTDAETPAHASISNGSNLTEEQIRMAMLNGMHPNFAAGLQAGMQFHHPAMLATAGGSGQLMGASNGYNPAFYHAMMAGMGVGAGGMGVRMNSASTPNAVIEGTDASQSGGAGNGQAQQQQQQQQQQHPSMRHQASQQQ
jgi:hypothetical protein